MFIPAKSNGLRNFVNVYQVSLTSSPSSKYSPVQSSSSVTRKSMSVALSLKNTSAMSSKMLWKISRIWVGSFTENTGKHSMFLMENIVQAPYTSCFTRSSEKPWTSSEQRALNFSFISVKASVRLIRCCCITSHFLCTSTCGCLISTGFSKGSALQLPPHLQVTAQLLQQSWPGWSGLTSSTKGSREATR